MAFYRYPRNLENVNLHPGIIQFQFFERQTQLQRLFPSDTVQLYMPEQSSAPSSVSWDSEQFGFIGNTMSKMMQGGSSATDIQSTMSGALDRVKHQAVFTTAAGAAQTMANKAKGMLGTTGMSANGLGGQVAGKVPNPYLTCIFRGVDFRNFNFTFKFTPLSENDCDLIHNIVTTMRKHAYPYQMDESAFLSYPSECMIAYFWKGKLNPYMHRFKRAVCTGIDVDYSSAGSFAMLRNGMPAHITVSTQWKEIEVITRQDIENLGF